MWPYYLANLGMGGGGMAPPAAALSLRETVVAWLNGITDLTNSVGPRIYWEDPSQLSTYPCIVVQVIDRKYGHNLDGADGHSLATVHIEAISQFESSSVACIEAVRNHLDGFRGYPLGNTGMTAIGRCLLTDERDASTPPLAGSNLWIYHVSTEYEIWHRLTFPTAVTQTNI